jgi:tetratricopeptide (TPR) repeat protein
MGKIKVFLFSICFTMFACLAMAQDVAQLHETARTFMRQGDYANAVLILNRAILLDPKNIEIAKDLGLNYYFSKDYTRALDICKPLLDRDDADDQCFQIVADIYLALDQPKDCDKVYKKGLKKFPESGALYNESGELMWAQKDYGAIKQWEKGIEMDPGFSKNYFNASRYYYFTKDKVWSILYGEIFLNIEPMGASSQEIKNILLESYKKLFMDADIEKNYPDKNSFVLAFLHTMNKETALASGGIDVESLTMIRARFILDWYTEYGDKYPYKLFELQRQLLQEGMFDAYNQWIFTSVQNLPAYQNWTNAHAFEYNELTRFQTGRIFKIPAGQYYH